MINPHESKDRKYEIMNHAIDAFIKLGENGNFKVIKGENRGTITGFSSPLFNYLSFGKLDTSIVDELVAENIPFICIPQEGVEQEFEAFCIKHGITKIESVIANELVIPNDWHYEVNPNIEIKEVLNEEELTLFDTISSTAFEHPKGMAVQFLKPAFKKANRNVLLFLAYYQGNPAGCGLISFASNQAGLYWGGVLPEYRRNGIGTELTKHRINIAKQKGFRSVIAQNMPLSLGYYKKLGFQSWGSVHLYLCA